MTPDTATVPLARLAHGRTGDKGNTSSISVIAYEAQHWPLLVEQVTEARVAELFASRRPTRVTRYLLPRLQAMNFVLHDILEGGVNDALNLDAHGKSLSGLLLTLPVQIAPTVAHCVSLPAPQGGRRPAWGGPAPA
ncbi:hypothetical protein [Curvibacter lanceolatus]|jgi:hypothetical protein|uniref:AtuA-related protein n=1 Tax=Curvibacter lanceolatus TaxID=86182 RepID=UPI002354D749|nr:hypothetical protein [Curvibacter lanceolatus]